jgi:hypothetical protein
MEIMGIIGIIGIILMGVSITSILCKQFKKK